MIGCCSGQRSVAVSSRPLVGVPLYVYIFAFIVGVCKNSFIFELYYFNVL